MRGLSAARILERTRGNLAGSRSTLCLSHAIAVHAPIGLRNICQEMLGWRGAALNFLVLVLAIALALSGWRAAFAVFT